MLPPRALLMWQSGNELSLLRRGKFKVEKHLANYPKKMKLLLLLKATKKTAAAEQCSTTVGLTVESRFSSVFGKYVAKLKCASCCCL